MGEAKRRQTEIDRLKDASPGDVVQWRQAKEDERQLIHGIDPRSNDPTKAAAMARRLAAMFDVSKREKNIDPPVKYAYAKVDATLEGLRDNRIACSTGCSHCCHVWVSASAPEVLFISKLIRTAAPERTERVRAAHLYTRDYDFETRHRHPNPCPMLENHLCSIYDRRPRACRLAASTDAASCARSCHNLTSEKIPTPIKHLVARGMYSAAIVVALQHANLPHHAYEFNAALSRALEREDAERAWLSGEDVFSDVTRDPADVLSDPQTQILRRHSFG